MIDQISNLGFSVVSPAGTITTAGGTSSINLLSLQAQGTIGFVLDAALSTASSTSVTTKLQSSPDNSTWTDVTSEAFMAVTDTTGAGLQTLFVDSALLGQYVRAYDTLSGSASVIRSLTAVYKVKNK